MKKLIGRIHDESKGLDYALVGDYYLPDIQLAGEGHCICVPLCYAGKY